MKHKVFLGVMPGDEFTTKDRCVMLAFPSDDPGCNIVVKPGLVEADTLAELRSNIIAEIDARMKFVRGWPAAPRAAAQPKAPTMQIQMDCLKIDATGATGCNDMFLSLGDM